MANEHSGAEERDAGPGWAMTAILVGIGGGLGAAARHFLTVDLPCATHPLPWPTFAINVFGCFLIGVLTVLLESRVARPLARLFLITGFLGGFTTFSHYMDGIRELFVGGDALAAYIYTILTLFGGLVAVWFGIAATRRLRPAPPARAG